MPQDSDARGDLEELGVFPRTLGIGDVARNVAATYEVMNLERGLLVVMYADGTLHRLDPTFASALDWGIRLADVAAEDPDRRRRVLAVRALRSDHRCLPIVASLNSRTDDAEILAATDPDNPVIPVLDPVPRRNPTELAIERHRVRVADLGINYQGTRPAGGRTHRVTHCWACHHALDNAVDAECLACGWIICRCGACGCGYGQSA